MIPEKDNSDFLDQFLVTSLAHAHPIHHFAGFISFTYFWSNSFLSQFLFL